MNYANRHNIKPVSRNFKRGAPRAALDEAQYRINIGTAEGRVNGLTQLAKTTVGQVQGASKQQAEEALYVSADTG